MKNKSELFISKLLICSLITILNSCSKPYTEKDIGKIRYQNISCVQILLITSSDSYQVLEIIPNKTVQDILK